jgi:hypothetical protein
MALFSVRQKGTYEMTQETDAIAIPNVRGKMETRRFVPKPLLATQLRANVNLGNWGWAEWPWQI